MRSGGLSAVCTLIWLSRYIGEVIGVEYFLLNESFFKESRERSKKKAILGARRTLQNKIVHTKAPLLGLAVGRLR